MNKKTVMVFGTFDYLHFGHVRFLEYAKSLGDTLIVVIGRDTTVHSVKGKKSHVTEQERVRAIKNLGIARTVVLGDKTNRMARIQQYMPDIVCLGYDQKVFVDVLRTYVRTSDLKIKIVRAHAFNPATYKSSLLNIKTPLIRGAVQEGLGQGRLIGFPTANIDAPAQARKGLARGIYAARVLLGSTVYIGAAAIGVRNHNNAPLVEVHVLGVKKNLYGKTLTITLDKKIRNVRSYKNTALLTKAISSDILKIDAFYKNQ